MPLLSKFSGALTRAKISYYQTGMCLRFVRTRYPVAAKHPDAATAWRNTKYRHTTTPPPGVPVWWTGGSRGFGHVAISAGNGYVYSTDYPSKGRVGKVKISWITRYWYRQTYRGWSEDINGVRVYKASTATALPVVDLSRLVSAARTDPSKASSYKTYSSGTLVVERALNKLGYLSSAYVDGHFGTLTKGAYARWQRALGYTGSDADGIPGKASLTKLGSRFGFKVTD